VIVVSDDSSEFETFAPQEELLQTESVVTTWKGVLTVVWLPTCAVKVNWPVEPSERLPKVAVPPLVG